jgi:signal transduction histidine kinase
VPNTKIAPSQDISPRALSAVWRWLKTNTFVPRWMPERWRHPAVGYVLAVLLQVVATAACRQLTMTFPTFSFPDLLGIVAVALVALSWGAGPSLLATLVGVALQETVVVPFQAEMKQGVVGDVFEVVLLLIVGVSISLLASMTEGSRQRAVAERTEAQARELAVTEVQRRMDEFLATAAHDLRSPVTGAAFGVELAQRRLRRLAATPSSPPLAGNRRADRQDDTLAALGALEKANQAVQRLSRLIVTLFDVAQARSGRLELRLAACDLVLIVREQVEAQRLVTPGRAIRLEPPAIGSVHIVADADRIGQVLTNYLTNALKYSAEDQPVAVALEVREGWARVTVRDEGPGLAVVEQARIWEPFHRVPGMAAQSGAGGGLGLGLHICKRIVELHRGRVGVESEVGRGSTFWFTLPLAPANRAANG